MWSAEDRLGHWCCYCCCQWVSRDRDASLLYGYLPRRKDLAAAAAGGGGGGGGGEEVAVADDDGWRVIGMRKG